MISRFGLNGNGEDRVVLNSYTRGRIRIICATKNSTDAPPDWFFENGTRIGFRNRNLKVTRSSDGTAILRIADFRSLSYCDGGTYTCIVNVSSSDHYETKNFTLIINCKHCFFSIIIQANIPTSDCMYLIYIILSQATTSWSTICGQSTEHEHHNFLA